MRLKKIDLNKMDVSGDFETCPGIREGRFYLAKIKKRWYTGTFSKLWYGYNFNAVYDAGYQLSYGGWEELYQIVEEKVE